MADPTHRAGEYNVFITCRWRDEDDVLPLRNALFRRGDRPYVDHYSATPGDERSRALRIHAQTRLTIVFISGAADTIDGEQQDFILRAGDFAEVGDHRVIPVFADAERSTEALAWAPGLRRFEPIFRVEYGSWDAVAERIHGRRADDPDAFREQLEELDWLKRESLRRHREGEDTAALTRRAIATKNRLRGRSRLSPGVRLGKNGRYTLQEEITFGTVSSVWKARDEHKQWVCAIKALHPRWAGHGAKRDRFLRGVEVLRRAELGLSRVAAIVDGPLHDQDLETHYYVMPLYSGDLGDRARDRTVDAARVGELVSQIGGTLAIMHDIGIVHRDVKPGNILVEPHSMQGHGSKGHDARPAGFVLADFDSVHVVESASGFAPLTVLYSAPEALRAEAVIRPSADIFSLARTALFVLAGGDLPLNVMRDERAFIEGQLGLSDRLTDVLCGALEWRPEDRPFEDMRDFVGQFLDALADDAVWRESSDRRQQRRDYRALVALLRGCQRGDGTTTMLDADELARVEPHLVRLERDEQLRAGSPSIDEIVARSRRRVGRQRHFRWALTAIVLTVVGTVVGIGAWYANLMAHNRGLFHLRVSAFDVAVDGSEVAVPPGALAEMEIRLFEVGGPDTLTIGAKIPGDAYEIEPLAAAPGATGRFEVDAPGGRYALVVFNRNRPGEPPCPESIIWEVELPGFPDRKTLGAPPVSHIVVPSCRASATGRVSIPAGPTWVGADINVQRARGVESPNAYGFREVELDAFEVDRWETSNDEYGRFVEGVETIARTPTPRRRPEVKPRRSHPHAGRPDHPATYVSWYDARDYCLWHGKTLLTFAQYQRVGRGPASADNPSPKRMYPWGDVRPDDANRVARARTAKQLYRTRGSTVPVWERPLVGPLEPPHDVVNLVGNAGVWLADGEWPDAIPEPGARNPRGSWQADQRLFHAGHWILRSYPELFELSYADVAVPGNRLSKVGIRCAWHQPAQGQVVSAR